MSPSTSSTFLGQLQCIGVGLLLDGEHHRMLPVDAAIAAADGAGVANVGHFADGDRHRVARPNHRGANVLKASGPANDADQCLLVLRQQEPATGDDVRFLHRAGQFVKRHVMGIQPLGRGEHLVLLQFTAHHRHLGHAGNGQQPLSHHPVGRGADFHGGRFAGRSAGQRA